MTPEEVGKIIAKMKGKKVLVIGDVMLDEYFKGNVTRISPEAPIPVVEISEHFYVLGGAANVANNVRALQGEAQITGVIGSDEAGSKLRKVLNEKGIRNSGLLEEDGRKTTIKTRIIAQNQQVVRYDIEEKRPLSAETEQKIAGYIEKEIANCDVAIISDYAKGMINKQLAQKISEMCKKNSKPLVVDSKGFLSLGIKDATLLKPNAKELQKETGMEINSDEKLQRAAETLMKKLSPKAILVTMGEKGMVLFERNGTGIERTAVVALVTEVYDVSGAGDTVLSTISLGLAAGASLRESMEVANFAAAVVVRKLGTAVALPNEVVEAAKNYGMKKS